MWGEEQDWLDFEEWLKSSGFGLPEYQYEYK
jgi:hypothetical protein